MKRPTLLEIIRTALYIGTIGYRGSAILALMKKVIVHEKAWISEEEFMNALSLAALSFSGITFLHWNVVYIILISGLLGALFFYFSGEFEQEKMPGHLKVEIDGLKIGKLQNYLPLFIMAGLLAALFWLISGTWTIYATFLKIGALAFGGGYAAIPLVQQVVVDGMHWLNLTAFRDGIALGQITPGPVFITATFIGFKVKGIIGALIATIGIFTPSLAAIMEIPGQIGHPFRLKSATDSGANRPVIPIQIGHL
ncbi:MAG: chromate transporter, partial [Syntrophaceae bacterium]